MSLRIVYRGSLSSCNYACAYCPFAKTRAGREQLRQDKTQLQRFCGWVGRQGDPLRLLFTPWGEALIWPWYQQALTWLSRRPLVRSVAIQTNLSGPLAWLAQADTAKITLWASYHPDEVSLDAFVAQCKQVLAAGARLSAGAVGIKQHFGLIEELYRRLPATASFWVNACKDEKDYYSAQDVAFLRRLDPFFEINLRDHPSAGKPCFSGETVFTVDGTGDMRRCHFIEQPIGNLYRQDYRQALKARPCTNQVCACYLGYIHLKELDFSRRFGPGYFERYRARGECPGACAGDARHGYGAASS